MMENKERPLITIQDKVYYRDEFSSNDDIMLKNINYIQEEIDRIEKQKVIAQMARDSVVEKLVKALATLTPVTPATPATPAEVKETK